MSVDQKLIEVALRYERQIVAITGIVRTYDRMKQQAPSMSPESAIECIREALESKESK